MRNFNLLKTLFAVAFGLLLSVSAYAQTKSLTGKVTGAADGLGIPGVSILIKETTRGTITDMDGNFNIQVMDGDVLVFSFIGMKTIEVPFTGQKKIDIVMEDDFVGLDEVVAIGYGTVKKEDLTGSVQAISSDDFNVGAISSPQELIKGKMSGVQVISGGGQPGAEVKIRIRGGSSLNASKDPLVVVDGVPLDDEDIEGSRNVLNVVNPNDIETFTVLKDASATAIYGSRASNGVILITTKKGSKGGIKVSYSGNVSVSSPTKLNDVMGADTYRKTLAQIHPENTNLLGGADTDWQNEVYSAAVSTEHNISVGGSIADIVPIRASYGFTDANGILEESSMQRHTATLNLNPTFLDDHLKFNISAKGTRIYNNFSNEDAIGGAMGMDPTQPVMTDGYDRFGGYYTWTNADGSQNTISAKNPVAQIKQRVDKALVDRFIGKFEVDYKFHFLPELRANLNLAYDYTEGQNDGYKTTASNAGWDATPFNRDGRFEDYIKTNKNQLLDFYLQYQKTLGKNNIDLMAGHSYQRFRISDLSKTWYGEDFDEENDEVLAYDIEKDNPSENFLISYFGRINYNYDNRYYLTATLRNDNSSRFSEENRSGIFPSAAVTWNLMNEDFMSDVSTLSLLKLRGGVGVTGQQNIGSNYGYFGVYTRGYDNATYQYYDPATGQTKIVVTTRPEGYDANLKWEETTTYNIALDYGFLNNRINGSIDIYEKDTKDLLSEVNVAAGANLENQLVTNIGKMKNQGVEFSINTLPYSSNDWKWEIGANFTYNINEIKSLSASSDETYMLQTGDISGGTGNKVQVHTQGEAANSFYLYEQVYDSNNKPIEGLYVDQNGDGSITDADKVLSGNPTPKYMFGINTSLNYKNFDFSLSGHANLDYQVYNNVFSSNAFYDHMQTNGQFLSNVHNDVLESGFHSAQFHSDYYLEDGSFFRLDNISLGYTINDLFGDSGTMRIYGTVNNAFIITKYRGLDPELESGIDRDIYPRPRTFLMGVNLTF